MMWPAEDVGGFHDPSLVGKGLAGSGQSTMRARARVERVDPELAKGWCLGPWNSPLDIAVGYAQHPPDEPHLHRRTHELYLVARGTCRVRLEQETVALKAGDVLHVGPGEAHTFLGCSNDYFHFVIHTPGLAGDAARTDKCSVARTALGLDDEGASEGSEARPGG